MMRWPCVEDRRAAVRRTLCEGECLAWARYCAPLATTTGNRELFLCSYLSLFLFLRHLLRCWTESERLVCPEDIFRATAKRRFRAPRRLELALMGKVLSRPESVYSGRRKRRQYAVRTRIVGNAQVIPPGQPKKKAAGHPAVYPRRGTAKPWWR
jgi:hypothetical protein